MGTRLAAPIIWSAFILWPAAGWGWLDGVPLIWIEAAALAAIWWAWAGAGALPSAAAAVVLLVAKIVLGAAFVERGFSARYYANDAWTAPFERSLDDRREAFTRVDNRLAFGSDAYPDLPLHFFNEERFNFVGADMPRRDQLAYSVEWSGYFRVDDTTATKFYVDGARGVLGELSVDGRPVIPLDTGRRRSSPVALAAGWHAVSIRISAPYGSGRAAAAGEVIGDEERPFDAASVVVEPAGTVRLAVDVALGWVTRAVDLGLLAWLALLVITLARDSWRTGRIGHLLWLAAIVEAVAVAWGYAGGMVLLTGGDDWLSYESYARAIAFGDIVEAGQPRAFYYQPLYPYFVALTHLGFGDRLFGAVLIQRLLLAATVGWMAVITRRLFGPRAGWIALVAGGLFVYIKIGRWTTFLINELLFIPLVAAWLALLIMVAGTDGPTRRTAVAGVLGGAATLTRSTLLLAWAPVLLLWAASLRARRLRLVGVLLAAMLAVVSLATLRNWVVADRFVLVASSLGINLLLGNQPPSSVGPAPPDRTALYDRLGVDDNTRRVAEFAVQAPGDFITGLGQKALYAVGFFGWSRLPGGIGTSWLYVGAWVLAVAGAVRLIRGSPTRPTPAVWLPMTASLTHFAVMVVIIPFGYTDKYILPLYPTLIPYAAHGAEALPSWWRRLSPGLPSAAALALGPLRRFAAIAAPRLRQRRDWLYFAYAAAAVFGVAWRPEASTALDLTGALLLPLTALTAARLTQADTVNRLVGAAIWAAAIAHVAVGGSRAITAVNDPIFWGVVALVALGVSFGVRRWPAGAAGATAVAGACTMVATLLPVFPDFDSRFPRLTFAATEASLSALADQFGVFGLICLFGVWIQALAAAWMRAASSRITAAAGGALLAVLLLALAGALPESTADWRLWLVILGVLLGLAEARARSPASRSRTTRVPARPSASS